MERFSLSLRPKTKSFITSNTIDKGHYLLLARTCVDGATHRSRLLPFKGSSQEFSSRVFHGSCCCPCLAVWPQEEWEEHPQPAKWSYACQLKTLVNNDSIDYSTSIQTCGYALVISLFSSQCACVLPYIH